MKIQNKLNFLNSISEEALLAYEAGVHLGDGSLQIDKKTNVHRAIFSGDSERDREFYGEIFPKVLERIYGKTPRIYTRNKEKTILVVLNSKEMAIRKVNLGMPVGNKSKLEKIPEWLRKPETVAHFIRGLADADFSVNFKKNRKWIRTEPKIEFFTNNEVLAKFVHSELQKLGFKAAFEDAMKRGFREFRVRMYGKKMLQNWMMLIGFSNPKHLVKIHDFMALGHVPSPSG